MKVKILQSYYSSEVDLVGLVFKATYKDGMYYVEGSDILAVGGRYFAREHKYSFSAEDVQEIRETFKVGDKVRLKKEFYKEYVFKANSSQREWRRDIAGTNGKTLTVSHVHSGFYCDNFYAMEFPGMHFPIECFELAEPEKKPVVEVNRQAKIGEWIKVVNAQPNIHTQSYKDGDIIRVSQLTDVKNVEIGGDAIFACEYVVLENYEPKKKNDDATQIRKWTPEEIVKAKCFLGGELIYAKCKFVYDKKNGKTACFNYENGKSAETKCAPNDEFNTHIGAVVAYCKTCGVKIPEFITR